MSCPNDKVAARLYCLNKWASPVGFNGDAGKVDVIDELFDANDPDVPKTHLGHKVDASGVSTLDSLWSPMVLDIR
ncbi:MAG: hypothetical protein AB8C95_05070 [Phycisphaeraceae bacterium]